MWNIVHSMCWKTQISFTESLRLNFPPSFSWALFSSEQPLPKKMKDFCKLTLCPDASSPHQNIPEGSHAILGSFQKNNTIIGEKQVCYTGASAPERHTLDLVIYLCFP